MKLKELLEAFLIWPNKEDFPSKQARIDWLKDYEASLAEKMTARMIKLERFYRAKIISRQFIPGWKPIAMTNILVGEKYLDPNHEDKRQVIEDLYQQVERFRSEMAKVKEEINKLSISTQQWKQNQQRGTTARRRWGPRPPGYGRRRF